MWSCKREWSHWVCLAGMHRRWLISDAYTQWTLSVGDISNQTLWVLALTEKWFEPCWQWIHCFFSHLLQLINPVNISLILFLVSGSLKYTFYNNNIRTIPILQFSSCSCSDHQHDLLYSHSWYRPSDKHEENHTMSASGTTTPTSMPRCPNSVVTNSDDRNY